MLIVTFPLNFQHESLVLTFFLRIKFCKALLLFSFDAEKIILPKELSLCEGTRHTVMSDVEEPGSFSDQIKWITTTEYDQERFTELAMSILESPEHQCVTVPALQQFVGLMSVNDFTKLIDLLVDTADACNHKLVIPTMIYKPAQYQQWDMVKEVNTYLRQKSLDMSSPLLNLSRSFLSRQQSSWVVSGICWQEYVDGTGLGSCLSTSGLQRYASRLERFHSFLDSGVESPVSELVECPPLPLWHSFCFSEKRETAAILTDFGYNLRKRKAPQPRKAAKKSSSPSSAQKSKVVPRKKKPVSPVAEVVVAVGEPEKVEVMETEESFSVLPVDVATFRCMISQVSDLKGELRTARTEGESKEKELRRIRKALEGYKKEVKNLKYEMGGVERRNRTLERHSERQAESHYQDSLDWVDEKREWGMERGELLDRLDEEQEKRRCLEASYSSLEEWSDKFRDDVGAARRVRENRERIEDMRKDAVRMKEKKEKKEKRKD